MKTISTYLRRDIIGFSLLFTGAAAIGLLVNQFREEPLSLVYQSKENRLGQAIARIQAEESAQQENLPDLPQQLALDQFQEFVSNQKGLVLDARPEIFHRLGHIPGAHSLPREDFEKAYSKLKPVLESHKNRPVVVYCSSASCEDSKLLKQALTALGFQQVVVFTGGWSAWTEAELPEESGS